MIVGPKKTLFMDEISTGLDSSTTFQIIKCLRDFAHLRLATVFISLLQPPPEVFNLFDDVLLLSEGKSQHLSCLPHHDKIEDVTKSLVPLFMLTPLCLVTSGCDKIDTMLNVWSVWQASEDYAVPKLTEEVQCCWWFHVMSMLQSVSMHICLHDEYMAVLQCQADGSFLTVSPHGLAANFHIDFTQCGA